MKPRTMTRRRPKGAAASIIILFSAITLMMLTIMGYVYGRVATAKEETSALTDAIVMTMTEAIKRRGPDEYCNDPTVRQLLVDDGGQGGPTPCPRPILVGANAYRLEFRSREHNVEVPTGLFDIQNVEVSTTSVGQISHKYVEAQERRPKFVLVLDYSGSMRGPIGRGGGTRIAALKNAVNGLLGRGYRIDYGAVLFDDQIMATVPVARDNERAVANVVNSHGPDGGTCYHGISTALNLLRQHENMGYYILFVSDGEPNGGCSNGRGEAQQAWNADVTIFTLFINDGGHSANLDAISGTPQRRRDANLAFVASDANSLNRAFDSIMGLIACRVEIPPADVAPDRQHIYVSLEQNGREHLITQITTQEFENNLPAYDGRKVFAAYPNAQPTGYLSLNHPACAPVIAGDGKFVLRYQRSGLAQQ